MNKAFDLLRALRIDLPDAHCALSLSVEGFPLVTVCEPARRRTAAFRFDAGDFEKDPAVLSFDIAVLYGGMKDTDFEPTTENVNEKPISAAPPASLEAAPKP